MLAVLPHPNESGLLEGLDGPMVFGSRIDRYLSPAGRQQMQCESTDGINSQASTLSLRLENDVYATIGGFVRPSLDVADGLVINLNDVCFACRVVSEILSAYLFFGFGFTAPPRHELRIRKPRCQEIEVSVRRRPDVYCFATNRFFATASVHSSPR